MRSGKVLIRRLIACAAAFVALPAVLDLALPPPLQRAANASPLALDRNGTWLHAFTTAEGRWRFAADLDEIDPVFIERLIAIEDERFYAHPGVDPLAIMRAIASSARAGEIVSGASTITMQTARLLEPRPRTLRAKVIEMIRAVQIERRLTKQEILELYLTLAPYGGNIEGVRAASLAYFGKEPSHLTDAEQALLIALPQAPEARRPDLRPEHAQEARTRILDKLAKAGAVAPNRAAEAADAILPQTRRSFDRLAWHTSRRLAHGEHKPVRTTIDATLQRRAEALVARYAENHRDGATASLLIIENETRAVRASVGSSSLDADGGWIDLTGAVRSPGSTLKPFIYALAMDDGRLRASSIIEDMPRAFGDYTPENFDRRFRGEVRVTEALQHSLNLPAVAALEAVGARRFFAAINAAGVDIRAPARTDEKPGLALALGGAGVTARDLGVLYAGLAEGGEMKPLKWLENDETYAPTYRLMSEDASRRISAILADAPSLAGRAPAALSASAQRVAFKTGTSYGFRDAWAAGHGGGYAIVAWVGRADGGPRPGETGRRAAAPLLFDAFDLVGNVLETRDTEIVPQAEEIAPPLLADPLQRRNPPRIVFPQDGVELFLSNKDRAFLLAARGGAGDYTWFVDGARVEEHNGRALWAPAAPGFFDVIVVDGAGKSATSKVRVLAAAPA